MCSSFSLLFDIAIYLYYRNLIGHKIDEAEAEAEAESRGYELLDLELTVAE